MKLERTATFRLDLWDNERPSDVFSQLRALALPFGEGDFLWIPQTLGDQIWIWIEFSTPEVKEAFCEALPEGLMGVLVSDFTQEIVDEYSL